MSESWRMSFSVSFAMQSRHLRQRAFFAPPRTRYAPAICGDSWKRYGSAMPSERSALVTGGTGGLGAAVVARLLGDGWRVVVPWVAERELERVQGHERLELVEADLFEQGPVAAAVALAAGAEHAPLRAVVNLVGGFAQGARVAEAPI